MTSPSVQFVELVREAHANLTRQTYPMYCEQCGKITRHVMSEHGGWEIYTCKCGTQKEYKVE